MYFPTYHTLNFFENPDDVLAIANKLDYKPSDEGRWPGQRTENLGEVHNEFFNHLNAKILRLIYNKHGVYDIEYCATTMFQKTKYEDVKDLTGWTHTDTRDLLTYMVYLTPGLSNCGTSIQISKRGKFAIPINTDIKKQYYNKSNADYEKCKQGVAENNNQFETVAEFKSQFNSMIAFDSSNYHVANFNLQPGQERLTLIGFFHSIKSPYFPIPDSNLTFGG